MMRCLCVSVLLVLVLSVAKGQTATARLLDQFSYLRNANCKVVINRSYTCSGTVIAGTDTDRVFVVSAAHCLPEDQALESVHFLFGEYRSLETSEDIGGLQWSSNGDFELLSLNRDMDFVLFEMTDEMPPYLASYAMGWDAHATLPAYAVSFHFSDFADQQIALKRTEVSFGDFAAFPEVSSMAFWCVPGWSAGRTGEGASGAGLVGPEGYYLGGLSGSTYTSRDTIDYYFRFDRAYNYGVHSSEKLAIWLDPDGRERMEGHYFNGGKRVNAFFRSDSITRYQSLRKALSFEYSFESPAIIRGVYLAAGLVNVSSESVVNISLYDLSDNLLVARSVLAGGLNAYRENYIDLLQEVEVEALRYEISTELQFEAEQLTFPMVRTVFSNEPETPLVGFFTFGEGATLIQTGKTPNVKASVFPNPASSYSFVSPYPFQVFPQVLDQHGKKQDVKTWILNDELVIDWSDVNSGNYFVLTPDNEVYRVVVSE